MKSALMLGFVVSMLCVFTTALIEAWWLTVAVQTAIAATAVAYWAVQWARRERVRMARVAALLRGAYEDGATVVKLDVLEPLVDDPLVMMARAEAATREAVLWAQRYANGECSDY